MSETEKPSANVEAARPTWRFPHTPTEARTLATQRIEQYLELYKCPEHIATWKSMNDGVRKPHFTKVLAFAVHTLELKSIDLIDNTPKTAFTSRAKFLEPFSISMEHRESEDRASENTTTSMEIVSEKGDLEPISQNEPTSSEELRLFKCLELYNNVPPTYTSKETTHNGISTWTTTISHPINKQIHSIGKANTKLASRALAAQEAFDKISQQQIIAPATNPPQRTNPTTTNIVEEEIEELVESELDASFESTPSGATPNLIAAIHKHAEEILNEKFESLLPESINSMANLFDTRIKNVLDETVDDKLQSFSNQRVQDLIDRKTTQVIQSEINHLAKTSVTQQMKENVISSVAQTISKTADRECTHIFENRLKVQIGKVANDHKKALQEVANDAEKSIHTFKRDALLAINECTENNAQLLVRDKLEIKSNREQMKIDLKNNLMTLLPSCKKKQTNILQI